MMFTRMASSADNHWHCFEPGYLRAGIDGPDHTFPHGLAGGKRRAVAHETGTRREELEAIKTAAERV